MNPLRICYNSKVEVLNYLYVTGKKYNAAVYLFEEDSSTRSTKFETSAFFSLFVCPGDGPDYSLLSQYCQLIKRSIPNRFPFC